ncbi:MAG: hypothetical protein PUP93_34460 [Rhizonema sp. NSF051]|nr:hypothetical protein [Rhizonema sp. NSF051]
MVTAFADELLFNASDISTVHQRFASHTNLTFHGILKREFSGFRNP